MEFDETAQLDTSQISDQRSSGGMMSGGSGLAIGGGGLGIVGLLVVLLVNVLGGGGGNGGSSGLGGLLNGGSGAVSADNSKLKQECRTGADANKSDTRANVAVVKHGP